MPGIRQRHFGNASSQKAQVSPAVGRYAGVERGPSRGAAASHAMPVRLLLIEDGPFDRELVRHALTRLAPPAGPPDVVSAGSWHEAWPYVAAGRLDLIVLDFELPGLSGLDALARLARHPHPPVVVVSAQDALAPAVEAFRAGARDYVRKQGDWGRELRRAVERQLVRAELARELVTAHVQPPRYAPELAENVEAARARALLRATELERLYVKTEEMARFKAEIVANVSHELRTPLNSVLGYADLLADSLPSETPADARAILDKLRTQARRLNAVVASVLSVDRLRAARDPVAITGFALAGLVEELRADAMVLNAETNLAITWRTPRRGHLEHDREKLRAIATQLLGNAIKFTPAGAVHVTIDRTPSGGVTIEVRDTGIGIPDADRARIFEDFVQVDGSSTRRYAGLGLGLGIVKRYTALLRGTVRAHATPGGGTTVRVELPSPAFRRRRSA